MWYGLVPNQFFSIRGEYLQGAAIRSILTTVALYRLPPETGVKLWESIYWPTAFFTGTSDDGLPADYVSVIKNIFGENIDLNDIPAKLYLFYGELQKMPAPVIIPNHWPPQYAKQFRFMGQRYLPDTEILQKLTDYNLRPFPTGLDVFAVLGSGSRMNDEEWQTLLKEDRAPARPGWTKSFFVSD
jgi:hypothetical protein